MKRHGHTILEMLLVLTLIGIGLGLAAPRLSEYLAAQRRRAALNHFVADLYWTRMEALRQGRRVDLRLENSGRCPRPPRGSAADGWSIVPGAGGASLRGVPPGGLGVCLHTNGDAVVRMTSRGLPAGFENRTVWIAHGARADSVVVSVLGRVLRRF